MKKLFIAMCAMIMATSCCNSPKECNKECCEQECNPVIETIMSRRSIRKYKDQAVPRELLDKIAECGINAPNGMNAQQWEVRIVDNPEWLKSVTEAQVKAAAGTPMEKMFSDPDMKNAFRNAPAVIFIAHKPGMCTQIDCGLMAGNMVLAAKSLGLGSVCMMGPLVFFSKPEGKPYREQLGFSEGYQLLLCVGVGYADEEPEARPRNKGVVKYVE